MAVFEYQGFSSAGKSVRGRIEAATERVAFSQLTGEGITPTELRPFSGGTTAGADFTEQLEHLWNRLMAGRVPGERRVQFVDELATMIKADIPLLEALRVLGREEPHPRLKVILNDLIARVQKGESFSHALAQHPRAFPELLVTMVRVGETGGRLGEVLEKMAVYMEHQADVRGEIKGALTYPAVVLGLGLVTIVVLVTFVLPKIRSIFEGMQGQLPLPTRILLGATDWVSAWGWTLPIVLVGVVWGAMRLYRTRSGRELFDRAVLRVPVAGKMILQSQLARFASATASLLETGVPLLEALKVVRGLITNTPMRQLVDRTIERVTKGQSLSKSLSDSSWFPPAVTHLLGVGERTGRLGEMFDRVAERFEKQTRLKIRTMISLISPLMIVALAIGVGFIAASILLPIYQMNDMM